MIEVTDGRLLQIIQDGPEQIPVLELVTIATELLTRRRADEPAEMKEIPREVHDGAGVVWRWVNGGYQYRFASGGGWLKMAAEEAAAVVHPARVKAMRDVFENPIEVAPIPEVAP